MIIAIDYDGTWSADPALFEQFARDARERQHEVLVITNRSPEQAIIVPGMTVIYACGRPKRNVALESGHNVTVWIDDNPAFVDLGPGGATALGIRIA